MALDEFDGVVKVANLRRLLAISGDELAETYSVGLEHALLALAAATVPTMTEHLLPSLNNLRPALEASQ